MSEPNNYWEKRKKSIYYQVARALTKGVGRSADSIADIGSAGCPYLDWFDHIPKRVSVDWDRPYEAEGVISVKGNFLTWEPDQTYDVVTCFQVLEHVPEAEVFAQKLLKLGKIVVVSVPYKWERSRTKTHVNDPVDEEKMFSWFHREPEFEYVCREVATSSERLIQVYDPHGAPWSKAKRLKFALACRSVAAFWGLVVRLPRDVNDVKRLLVGPQDGIRARLLLPLWRRLKSGSAGRA